MDRRSLLSGALAAVTAGFAGCVDAIPADSRPQYHLEVTVQNGHDRAYDVQIVMRDDDGHVVFEQVVFLEPGDGWGFGDDFPPGEYTLTVELSDRSSVQSYWNTDSCEVYRVRTDIAADGHVSHDVACQSSDSGPVSRELSAQGSWKPS